MMLNLTFKDTVFVNLTSNGTFEIVNDYQIYNLNKTLLNYNNKRTKT